MARNHRPVLVLLGLLSTLGNATSGAAEPAATTPADAAMLARLRDGALASDWAWRRLAELTDRVGPRLAGSPQLEAAIAQLATTMAGLGARVELQSAKVPHWVRGDERAALLDYPGRPAGLVQSLHVTALGESAATPPAGLVAPLLVVRDRAALEAHAAEVPGRIVLFAVQFDQHLADNGAAMVAYAQAVKYRNQGPSLAAKLGAAAVLVRSVGGAEYRLPHTGDTEWAAGQAPVPAGALAAEDADLLERLAATGPVTLRLVLTPVTLPPAASANVIADWPGRELPDEYVLVSGHLDSWDLGSGAIDDGAGVIAAAAVVALLQQLDLHPRRTIRFVGWTSEEFGGQGADAYAAATPRVAATHAAVIESDSGAGRPLGLVAAMTADSVARLQPVFDALAPIGATALALRTSNVGADIAVLQQQGVPGFAPWVDTRHYFDYHHTAADTLDKVDPLDLRRQVATLAVLAWYLAELPEPLPRYAPPP